MRQEFEKMHEQDVLLCKTQHHLETYQDLLVEAVAVMENAAKTTTDAETFKILQIGFDKIKEGVKGLQ